MNSSKHIRSSSHPSKLDIFTCVSAPLSFTRGMPLDPHISAIKKNSKTFFFFRPWRARKDFPAELFSVVEHMLSSTHLPFIQFSLDLTLIQRIKPCVYDRDGAAFHFLKTSKLYYSLVSKEIYTGTLNSDIRILCTVHCGRNVNQVTNPVPPQKLKGKDYSSDVILHTVQQKTSQYIKLEFPMEPPEKNLWFSL